MTSAANIQERTQLLDALWTLQNEKGYIADADVDSLADRLGISAIEVEGVISFYHFFQRRPAGRYPIYLNTSITAQHAGYAAVRRALEKATGAKWGEVSPDGLFGLYDTSCIGLSDLEPAALIDFHPFTQLTPIKVDGIIRQLRAGSRPEDLADEVPHHIRYVPPGDRAVLLRPSQPGQTLERLQTCSPTEALTEIEQSGLRGMGGAFFPIGAKWRLCREQPARPKYVLCNADEGEPGTFKDRVLMQSHPELMIDGMILAAYCIGAEEGILYLRAEYRWLLPQLEALLERYRAAGWLGKNLPAQTPFDFDIHIQLGAGAYVCGEETALIKSLEGYRGEPTVRTYFPVERGYLGKPTIVNNVESFAAAARVLEMGAERFQQLGTSTTPGTRLLSVAGDCARPGVYEIEWGMTLGELLNLCGAENPMFVQVSGPSGLCVAADQVFRRFDTEDLRCGGAVTLFNEERDLLRVLRNFTDFFKEESCGVCTPCRAGNFIFSRKLDRMAKGLGKPEDRTEIANWTRIMQQASRCGLGKAATRALNTSMEAFPEYFDCLFGETAECGYSSFDLESATKPYRQALKPKTTNHE